MFTIDVLTTIGADDRAALIALLGDAVEHGASVGNVLPISAADMQDYWHAVAGDVDQGNCKLMVARRDQKITGTVQLALARKPNARHRAEVQKMLVHSAARRQGIGRQLMLAAEQLARQAQRELLVLDTETHSAGHRLYLSLGYQVAGEIPRYAIATSPDTTGGWSPSTFMYKFIAPA